MGFWDSFQQGYGAVRQIRSDSAQAKAAEGDMNPLMRVNPQLAMQMQQGQQRNALFDQQQTQYGQQQDMRQGRIDAMGAYGRGDTAGAQQAVAGTGDIEGFGQVLDWAKQQNEQSLAVAQRTAQRMYSLIDAVAPTTTDPQARLQAAMQMAPQLGFTPEETSHWTPELFSDQALSVNRTQALGIDTAAELTLSERKAAADQQYKQQQLDETRRYHSGQLGLGQQRNALQASSVSNANRNRDARTGIARKGLSYVPMGTDLSEDWTEDQ